MLTSESTRDPKRETSRVACFCLQNPGSMLPITPLHSLVPLANVPLRCFPNSKLQSPTLPLRVNPNTICRVAQTLHISGDWSEKWVCSPTWNPWPDQCRDLHAASRQFRPAREPDSSQKGRGWQRRRRGCLRADWEGQKAREPGDGNGKASLDKPWEQQVLMPMRTLSFET